EIAVEDTDEPVRLGGPAADRDERLVDLDRVLDEMRLEAVHPEADRLRAIPEEGRPLELVVTHIRELAEDPAMDLEERVANVGDPARHRFGRAVAVLRPPRRVALARLVVVAWPVGSARVLDDPEEAVLGAEHVFDDRAHRPLALRGRAIEIAVTHPREGAGQVAVCPVVLAEDALGLPDPALRHSRQRRPREVVDHGVEVPGLLPDAQLPVRARALAHDRLEVGDLATRAELVDDVIDKLEELDREVAHRHLALDAEVD